MKLPVLAVPFLAALPLFALVGCTKAQETKAVAALERADVVCVALIKDKASSVIAKACQIEEPLAATIRDGLAAYDDVRAGVSAGPDVSAAVAAAQAVGAAVVSSPAPADAGADR